MRLFGRRSTRGDPTTATVVGTARVDRRTKDLVKRIEPGDIEELAGRQKKILSNAARVVRRKGKLVYSTCSVEPEENEEVIAGFLNGHADFSLMPTLISEKLRAGAGTGRTWPHRDGTDGFFIAVFERRAE